MDTLDAPQIFEHVSQDAEMTPYDTKWLPYSPKCVLLGQNTKMEGIL